MPQPCLVSYPYELLEFRGLARKAIEIPADDRHQTTGAHIIQKPDVGRPGDTGIGCRQVVIDVLHGFPSALGADAPAVSDLPPDAETMAIPIAGDSGVDAGPAHEGRY
jgi:hypothetical protein